MIQHTVLVFDLILFLILYKHTWHVSVLCFALKWENLFLKYSFCGIRSHKAFLCDNFIMTVHSVRNQTAKCQSDFFCNWRKKYIFCMILLLFVFYVNYTVFSPAEIKEILCPASFTLVKFLVTQEVDVCLCVKIVNY